MITDDDLRAECIRLMGKDLGNLCHELQKEDDWLQHKWNQFQELFQQGEQRVQVLNNVAPNFFLIVQNLLYEDAMLTLSRLTDPPTTSGRSTLTVQRLPESISDSALKSTVQLKVKELLAKCKFAREWRHRRLAHVELPVILGGKGNALPRVTSTHIEDGLKSLREVLRVVETHYGIPPSVSSRDPWGANLLVRYLEGALQVEKAEPLRWLDLTKGN